VFGFFGSAIWLLVIGQWRSVVAGVVVSFSSTFFLGLALMPGMLVEAPGIYFAKRRITIGVYFFGLLSSIYTYGLIAAWCGVVTFYFLSEAPAGAFWPLLILAYGTATAPWNYMAQRGQSVADFEATFFMQVAYIVMMVALAFGASFGTASDVFGLVLVVGVITHMRMLAEMTRMRMLEE
jgi:hypothetical protein